MLGNKQEKNQTERKKNINEESKNGLSQEELQSFSCQLQQIKYSSVESNTVMCAASSKMRSQLTRIFGNAINTIISTRINYDDQPQHTTKIKGDEELVQAIECIKQIQKMTSEQLRNPIVILWQTNADIQRSSNMRAGPHWQTYVILPPNFVNYRFKNINNKYERLLFKDSLNKKKESRLLMQLLISGFEKKTDDEDQSNNNICGKIFPQLEVVLYKTDECVHQRHNDSGFWAVYNAIMLILQNDQYFLQESPEKGYDALFPATIKNGKKLRAMFQGLLQQQEQKPNDYSQEAIIESSLIRKYRRSQLYREICDLIKKEDKDKMLVILHNISFLRLSGFNSKIKDNFIDVDYLRSEVFNTDPTQQLIEKYHHQSEENEMLRIACSVNHSKSSSQFTELVESDFYVDKSHFIEDIWNYKDFIVITRPAGWGKSTFFNMIRAFFAPKSVEGINRTPQVDPLRSTLFKGGQINGKTFRRLKIADREEIMKQCGKWPVIQITFRMQTQKQVHLYFITAISNAFKQHQSYLIPFLESQQVDISKQEASRYLQRFIKTIQQFQLQSTEKVKSSLEFLSKLLFIYWKKKVILLIDDVDLYMNHQVNNPQMRSQISRFQQALLDCTLIQNKFLRTAVFFGNVEDNLKGMLFKMNNVKLFRFNSRDYDIFSQAFGFTEEQMDTLFEYVVGNRNWIAQKRKFKQWFNGYVVGGQMLYSPYPITYCLGQCKIQGYQRFQEVHQSEEDKILIKNALKDNIKQWAKSIYMIMTKGKVQFSKVSQFNVESISTFQQFGTMLITLGYLTPTGDQKGFFKFPNNRMKRNFFEVLLTKQLKHTSAFSIIQRLFNINQTLTDGQRFEKQLKDSSISNLTDHNLNQQYFKVIVGGMFYLNQLYMQEATHRVYFEVVTHDSNRIDTLFLPIQGKNQTVIIHQYKKANSNNQMGVKMQEALWQMYVRGYVMYIASILKDNKHWKYLIARAVVFYPQLGGDASWSVSVKENVYDFKQAEKIGLQIFRFFHESPHKQVQQRKTQFKREKGFDNIHVYLSGFSLKPQQQQNYLFLRNFNKKKRGKVQPDNNQRSWANRNANNQRLNQRQTTFADIRSSKADLQNKKS